MGVRAPREIGGHDASTLALPSARLQASSAKPLHIGNGAATYWREPCT
jgi:hypothetical protein